ncbi:MAG: hypothetical protein DWQ01_13245 [Planctomycetota bacterium]|nr:MAG: hypothetical protein DWQ01_13245 [Planctomycetota bacterium]
MILLAAGLAGFAVLSLEILGVHWLAPWFGASSLVWSNQIGVVLLAMAAGGWLGGRSARKSSAPERLAGQLLLAGGLLIATGLMLLPWVAAWFLPGAGLALEKAAGLFLGGSLTCALLFFAPPVLLLAMVAPLLVESRAKQKGAGGAAGEISACGTVGSLLGVFGSSFVAIPSLGTRLTLALVAAVLVLAGLLLARAPKTWLAVLIFPALPLTWQDAGHRANLPTEASGLEAKVLEVAETPYQRLRVVQFSDGERWLQMNEGLDSYQARWLPRSLWPGGYYDLFLLAPLYALEGRESQQPVRFWNLGFGTGATMGPVAAALQGLEWEAVGVELDPAIVELGKRYLPMPVELPPQIQILAGVDARAQLRSAPQDLDFILLDAYARQFEIPLHLATVEFFHEVAGHLRPGGVFAVNVGSSEDPWSETEQGGFTATLRATLAEAFGDHLRLHRVSLSRNLMLFARKDRPFPKLEYLAEVMPSKVPVTVGAACLPGQVLDGAPAETVEPFRDDRNPLALAQARLWLTSDA